MYTPPEGMLIRDIESAWVVLERAEHDRELALREELIRQEHLEQLAVKFEKKVGLQNVALYLGHAVRNAMHGAKSLRLTYQWVLFDKPCIN